MNGVLSVSLIEATLEPESWFGRRGVRRVVRIRGSGDSPVDGPGTAGPDDFPESPTEDESRWSEDLRGKSERELTFRELPLPVRRRRSGGRLGEHGELLEAEPGFRIVISTRYRSPQWLLLPHVDPAPVERRAAFRVAMRATLGLQPRQRLTSRRLSQALQDGKRREALRECYDEIIAGGARRNHNRVSMSLYSGPESWSANQTWKYWVQSCDLVRQFFRWSDMAWVPWELEFRPLLWRAETSSIGWIASGDAALKMRKPSSPVDRRRMRRVCPRVIAPRGPHQIRKRCTAGNLWCLVATPPISARAGGEAGFGGEPNLYVASSAPWLHSKLSP